MELGDDKWLRKLNESLTFPCRVAFNLILQGDGTAGIVSTVIKNKSKTENLKYRDVYAAPWTSIGSAVLSVTECNNDLDYLTEAKRLHELWGFALKLKNS